MLSDWQLLSTTLQNYAPLSTQDLEAAQPLWTESSIQKGDFFNSQGAVCRYLGFVLEGVFRIYYIDPISGEEVNVFFFRVGQLMVSFKSFTYQVSCQYFVEALTDSKILKISFNNLQQLYSNHHNWERFGRLFAEECFNISQLRTESFLFQTPEQRYIDFVKIYPNLFNQIPLYHIASYLGIKGPSLSRIRKRVKI
ncbi:MAG: Crp/Fnr family transcriptional regulator [Aureispira sp.]|nr:Crp/Fnr family transcriptional regulator [Aureispira sp.]